MTNMIAFSHTLLLVYATTGNSVVQWVRGLMRPSNSQCTQRFKVELSSPVSMVTDTAWISMKIVRNRRVFH